LLAPVVAVVVGGGAAVCAPVLLRRGAVAEGVVAPVAVRGGAGAGAGEERLVALARFEDPQPLIASESSKTLAAPGLKNGSKKVDKRRIRCDRIANISRRGSSSTTHSGAGCGFVGSDATMARPGASSPRPLASV
jgi:hypothetical protein